MAETAVHLSDHVLPRLPVRQWVLAVPKRLRYFMQRAYAVRILHLTEQNGGSPKLSELPTFTTD